MKVSKLMAFAAVLCIVGVALAAEEAPKKKDRPAGVFGKITKVDGTNLTVEKRTRGSKETTQVTIATDSDTKFTLDRKDATLADMKEGLYVFITPETGTAKMVRAMTELRSKGKDGDKGKKE